MNASIEQKTRSWRRAVRLKILAWSSIAILLPIVFNACSPFTPLGALKLSSSPTGGFGDDSGAWG